VTEEIVTLWKNEPKTVVDKSFYFKDEKNYRRYNFQAVGLNSGNLYTIFIRINKIYLDNFSVGIYTKYREHTKFNFVRYNGKHTSQKESPENHHKYCHIHEVDLNTVFDVKNGKLTNISITDKYLDCYDAFSVFCEELNFENHSLLQHTKNLVSDKNIDDLL
jgi:hypothetical protein